MDFPIKNTLAVLAVALACARSVEQLLPVLRSRRFGLTPTVLPQASVLSPFAGTAALMYGHAINADTALLIATWVHTATATFAVTLAALDFPGGLVAPKLTAQEITHD